MRARTGCSPQWNLLLDGFGSVRSRSWMHAALVLTSMPHLYAAGQRSPPRRPLTSCLSLLEPETGQVFTRIARSLFTQTNIIRDLYSSEPRYWRAGRRTVARWPLLGTHRAKAEGKTGYSRFLRSGSDIVSRFRPGATVDVARSTSDVRR